MNAPASAAETSGGQLPISPAIVIDEGPRASGHLYIVIPAREVVEVRGIRTLAEAEAIADKRAANTGDEHQVFRRISAATITRIVEKVSELPGNTGANSVAGDPSGSSKLPGGVAT